MRRLRRQCAFLLVPAASLWMVGCGGNSGGVGSSLTGSGGRAALNVFVTDGFTDQYKQVLATLYKIELTTDGTNYQTVYTDTTGQTIDLASLASTAELLASVTVPAGTYTQARITVGDHVTLVSNAGVSTSAAIDSSIGADANGQIAVTVATPTKVQSNQTNAVTVDFNLAEFKLVGAILTPAITYGSTSTAGQQGEQYTSYLVGAVTNLNGTSGFTLQTTATSTVSVTLGNATTIVDGQTGSIITLANGQNVIVQGAYNPTTSTVTATSVTLNDFTTTNQSLTTGTVVSLNTETSSFVLTVRSADNIQPTAGTITVQINANTQFIRGPQQTGSFSNVHVGSTIDVGGAFDTSTQTLTASFVGVY